MGHVYWTLGSLIGWAMVDFARRREMWLTLRCDFIGIMGYSDMAVLRLIEYGECYCAVYSVQNVRFKTRGSERQPIISEHGY